MVNASIWCLPSSIHGDWHAGQNHRDDTESYMFQQQKTFILQYDIDKNIIFTYLSSFSMNQRTVLLYELITQ